MSGIGRAAIRLAAFGLVVVGGAAILRDPYRRVEAAAAVAVLDLCGAAHRTTLLGFSVLLAPAGKPAFAVIVTPACSSLPSVLCLLCVASMLPGPGARRALACAAALASAVIGNLLRISASMGAGLLAGRSSLVLFHNSVGTVVTFASTLGGFILMLYLLLPAQSGRDRTPIGAP